MIDEETADLACVNMVLLESLRRRRLNQEGAAALNRRQKAKGYRAEYKAGDHVPDFILVAGPNRDLAP